MSFYATFSSLNTALFCQAVLVKNSAILCLAVYKQRGVFNPFANSTYKKLENWNSHSQEGVKEKQNPTSGHH